MAEVTILSWNVNGLRSIYNKGSFDWVIREKPDIMCLQETKAIEEQLPVELKKVDGYHSYFSSAERKGYSGVATYTRDKPSSVSTGFGIQRFDNEGRILVTHYDSFILFNIYFPNGKASPERLQYKMDFYNAFLLYVNTFREAGKNIVICGDINTAHNEIDLARPRENSKISGFLPEERAWIDKFIANGYVDTFRMFNQEPGQYTWWDLKSGARERNVGWRIDYFFVNSGFAEGVKASFIMPQVMGSDHCPVGIKLSFNQTAD